MSNSATRKIPVLIASTLKPIRDSRAFEKLAKSLGETNKYEVNIIGFSQEKAESFPGFRFFSSMRHFQSTWDRLLAQFRFGLSLFTTCPKLLVVCTFELLPLASLFKPFFRYKLIYDVQENYLLNLADASHRSNWKNRIARTLIRASEGVPGIDLYFFAESCYVEEMPRKCPYLVLENTYRGQKKSIQNTSFSEKLAFTFSITGTLSPGYGTPLALDWFEEILKSFPNSKLIVCGHVPVPSFYQELVKRAEKIPQLRLHISENPIRHEEILKVISNSDFSLLPYPNLKSISSKIPTKLYECAALGVPVLISPNPKWNALLEVYSGGASIDFQELASAGNTFRLALQKNFFTSPIPDSFFWKSQESDLINKVEDLLS